MQKSGKNSAASDVYVKDSKNKKWDSKKSRSESSHFDLIRIWLKISVDVLTEKKMMDQALQKHKDTMEAKHDFWSIPGKLYFINIML